MKTLLALLWLNLDLLLHAAPFPAGVSPEDETAISRDLAVLREKLEGAKASNSDLLAVSARVRNDGSIEVDEPVNINLFAIYPPLLQNPQASVWIGNSKLSLKGEPRDQALVFGRHDLWQCFGALKTFQLMGKHPGQQGPIDDAFTSHFCVSAAPAILGVWRLAPGLTRTCAASPMNGRAPCGVTCRLRTTRK